MKVYRVLDSAGRIRWASSEDERTFLEHSGEFTTRAQASGERIEVTNLLAPVQPPTIYCIGLNYRKHAEETGAKIPDHPVVFLKSPTALLDPGQPIVLPRHLRSDQVDYEGELAVIIGRKCKNVSQAEALDYVLGYTIANDVSARDWQKTWGGSQWSRGKTFDSFCPVGPAWVTREALPNPNHLGITTRLNGVVVQQSSTRDMIFSVAEIIEFLSGSTTLEPMTLILTGTPEGVGIGRKPPLFLKAGDLVEVEIEGIGCLSNPVIEEDVNAGKARLI